MSIVSSLTRVSYSSSWIGFRLGTFSWAHVPRRTSTGGCVGACKGWLGLGLWTKIEASSASGRRAFYTVLYRFNRTADEY